MRPDEAIAARFADGLIPFADFMAAALYDPEFGYYTRNVRTVGRRGDFSTSATLSDSLAKAITRWIRNGIRETGIRHVIEIGGGDGSLAHDILHSLGILGRSRLHSYTIVDISEPLIAEQKQRLGRFRAVRWSTAMAEALGMAEGSALVFSNEAADAFPADVFRRNAGQWEKLHLRIENGAREHFSKIEANDLPESSVFDSVNDWPDGQRIEVQESFRLWLREWAPRFHAGRLLTIDYGDVCPDIYYRRPRGSLRAYFHQTVIEGTKQIAANVGRQDITVDVNFTDLQRWGEELGLRTRSLETQAEFLQRHGVTDDRFAGGFGPGSAFKVLSQEVGK